jgi:hypothetical protein
MLLTVYVTLVDARPGTAFDVYVDLAGGTAGVHQYVGTFTTDDSGGGTFVGSIEVSSVGARIDNELVLSGQDPIFHQYIRERFEPCAA